MQAGRAFTVDGQNHVRDIAERYIVPGETAESALMFLPSEAVYAELHANFANIVEDSFRRRVWIVSPTTLMATLLTVRAILKEVGVASIYVTHDRDEAFAMADRLLCMNRGRIVQTGTPEEVFDAPTDEFVARSLGFKNIMRGVVRGRGEYLEIECAVGILTLGQQTPQPREGEKMLLIKESGIAVS